MDEPERRITDAIQRYQRGLSVLESGDLEQLERLAKDLEGFPQGQDPYIGRRWITNAIGVGSKAAVQWMLDQAVDLSFRDEEGYTPVHSAIESERPDRHQVLEMLLTAGAPVNAKGVNDWTPAHMAAAYDDVDALRLLVRYGADLTIRTSIDDYATPLEEARNLGKLAAASYLDNVLQR